MLFSNVERLTLVFTKVFESRNQRRKKMSLVEGLVELGGGAC